MALEALLSSTDLFNLIMYDSNSPTPFLPTHNATTPEITPPPPPPESGRKKRRRRAKVCKNKEEAETQRMTHIAVERNRRKQMNDHLAVLRSLMPESYVQRGDQASIVGGAIEFVKELEHILQSLEAKKFALLDHKCITNDNNGNSSGNISTDAAGEDSSSSNKQQQGHALGISSPFAQFFAYPQFSCSNKYTSQTNGGVDGIADIEVTLIETHANIRILSRRRYRQLSKLVVSFQTVFLTILHLNVTTLDSLSLVLYSVSAKVEEGCQLSSADEIAGAVHHMLRIIDEEEAILGL